MCLLNSDYVHLFREHIIYCLGLCHFLEGGTWKAYFYFTLSVFMASELVRRSNLNKLKDRYHDNNIIIVKVICFLSDMSERFWVWFSLWLIIVSF